MAIELKFSKSDGESPWGFRMVGGIDYEQPTVVVKVDENTFAEAAGLQAGDIIVRVNDTPTTGLTHNEVHDLIFSAGPEFDLGIRRGQYYTHIINGDEDCSSEVSNILEEAVQTEIINEAVKKVNKINSSPSPLKDARFICENFTRKEQSQMPENEYKTKSPIKWSTFLLKPDNPIPNDKKKIEVNTIEGEPYRVVINTHPKRPFNSKIVKFDENITEVKIDVDTEEQEETISTEITGNNLENIEVEVKVTETEKITIEEREVEEDDISCEGSVKEEDNSHSLIQNDTETKVSWSDVPLDASALQEQLLAVQKQLQALSQLPSTIQVTLDAISQQLTSIVGAKENLKSEGNDDSCSTKDEESPITEEEILEDTDEISEKAEAEVNGIDSSENSLSIGEEMEEDGAGENLEDKSNVEMAVEPEIDKGPPDPYAGMTEEERESAIKRENMQSKSRKAMEDRTPKPIERPIILPGGRRWCTPEDAIPKFRKPKMSDEKVVETIENNLEVIVGKRKGINFLKYQPPPTNLDFLQRSEVYRLIHDMEPPTRGIVSRPEKIAAVQDYYEASKEVS